MPRLVCSVPVCLVVGGRGPVASAACVCCPFLASLRPNVSTRSSALHVPGSTARAPRIRNRSHSSLTHHREWPPEVAER